MYFLAIDIGATSGKAILGNKINNELHTKVIHRFPNKLKNVNNQLCWDYDELFSNIVKSLKVCKQNNTIPETLSIDTWGVDFVLLDNKNKVLGNTVSYRDTRSFKSKKNFHNLISEFDLYKNTGIQIQEFNTVYQFKSIKDSTDFFEKAKTFLMTPDYFNFLLTGEKYNEYTNFTTTGFYDVERDEINKKIISLLGIEEDLFPHMIKPGEYIGSLRQEIIEDVGFNVKVIASASHDTASAVFSNNLEKELNTLYISSGTWSLVGTVNESPIININTFKDNFTNEGYTNGRITFIKNIMGLWIIESLRKEYNSPSFEEINKKLEGIHLDTVIDINDIRFLSPESMTEEIDKYINEHNLSNVNSIWEKLYIVYNSLAYYYGETINEIEKHTNKKFDSVYIMGGGSQSDLLNRLTKKYTSKNIVIGYVEATAIGNLRIQMMYSLNLDFIDLNNIKILEE